jgi:hypothetical protein
MLLPASDQRWIAKNTHDRHFSICWQPCQRILLAGSKIELEKVRSAGFEPAIPSLGSSYLNQAGLTSHKQDSFRVKIKAFVQRVQMKEKRLELTSQHCGITRRTLQLAKRSRFTAVQNYYDVLMPLANYLQLPKTAS